MIRVFVADDHGVVREGVQRLLEGEADMELCGQAADGEEALAQIDQTRPDVLILDLTMPRLSGLETLELVRARHPEIKTVLLSFRADPPLVESAVSLGADAYVLKNSRSQEILAAIREVMRGGCYFSPPVAREIAERVRSPESAGGSTFRRLSAREREVLRLIAEGLSAKEVARDLGISTKTVEAHRTSLMRKVGVRKATELVRFAVRHGLIDA